MKPSFIFTKMGSNLNVAVFLKKEERLMKLAMVTVRFSVLVTTSVNWSQLVSSGHSKCLLVPASVT